MYHFSFSAGDTRTCTPVRELGLYYSNCKTNFLPSTFAAFVNVARVTESLYGFNSLSNAARDVEISFAISVLLH